MIPKVIHYCWFGKKELPANVIQCINSWKKYCPEYEIKRWDESNFDVYVHPFVRDAYSAKAWAFVSDYARLKIVYDNGGIYLDTDVELIKPLDVLLDNHCYVALQQNAKLIATGLGFGAEEHHQMIKSMINEYDSLAFDNKNKATIACPWLNTKAFEKYGYQYSDDIIEINRAKVYPCKYFDPYPSGAGENLFCSDTISIHHYSASWATGMQQRKRKIARLIGENKILVIKKLIKMLKKTLYSLKASRKEVN